MEEISNFFKGGVEFNILSILLSLILGFISILLTIYYFKISKNIKRPIYAVRSINILSDEIKNIGDIKIKYKENDVENLTISKIAFWNNGNATLNRNDQAELDKLRLHLNCYHNHSYKILETEVIFQSHYTNNIRITERDFIPNDPWLSFDYLNKDQGGIIKVVHTGRKSSDIKLIGTFKDSEPLMMYNADPSDVSTIFNKDPAINRTKSNYVLHRKIKKEKIIDLIGIFVSTLIGIIFTWYMFDGIYRYIAIAPLLYTLCFTIYTFYYYTIGAHKGVVIPKGFEIFFDDE